MTYGFGNYDRDQLVDLARELIDGGHRRLKMLVGVPGPRLAGGRGSGAPRARRHRRRHHPRPRRQRGLLGERRGAPVPRHRRLQRRLAGRPRAQQRHPRPPAPSPTHRDPARGRADGRPLLAVPPVPGERRHRHPPPQPDVQRRHDRDAPGGVSRADSTRSPCRMREAQPISASTTSPASATAPTWNATSSRSSWRRTCSSTHRNPETGGSGSRTRRVSGSPSTATS